MYAIRSYYDVPYSGLIDFMKKNHHQVKKVIIVSRKSDLIPDVNKELEAVGVDTLRIFDDFGFSLDELLVITSYSIHYTKLYD